MALKNCHECKKPVSTSAAACPHCGATPKKRLGLGGKILLCALGVTFLPLILVSCISAIVGGLDSGSSADLAQKREFEERRNLAAKRKDQFESQIAKHYDALLDAKKRGDTAGALAVVGQFEKYGRNNYQDVTEIAKAIRLGDALVRLKGIEKSDAKNLASVYSELSKIAPENSDYRIKASIYATEWAVIEDKRIAKEKEESEARRRVAAREARVKAQFSQWDGSHIEFTRLIKETMHNPKSFEHVKTEYGDFGYRIVVRTTFRGTNGFGGIVKNTQTATYSENGAFLGLGIVETPANIVRTSN
jgi:hypothetical protein